MKIIHSCTSTSFSGLEQYVVELAEWQSKNQNDVVVYCRKNSEIYKNCLSLNIQTEAIPFTSCLAFIQTIIFWKKIALQNENLVLHLHHPGEFKFHWFALWLRSKKLTKVILQFHLWITHNKKDPWHKLTYSFFDEIWCSSNPAKKVLSEILPVARAKISVIEYGRSFTREALVYSEQNRNSKRQSLKIGSDEKIAICVSRIEKIKGIKECVEGFFKYAATSTEGSLILIGGPSNNNPESQVYTERLLSWIASQEKSLRDRFFYLGYKTDALEWMNACDFYVLPSFEECMSLALLDAAILGLPCLATQSGGTPDVVKDGVTGVLVKPQSLDAIALGFKRLFSMSQDERASMKKNIKELASQNEQTRVFNKICERYRA